MIVISQKVLLIEYFFLWKYRSYSSFREIVIAPLKSSLRSYLSMLNISIERQKAISSEYCFITIVAICFETSCTRCLLTNNNLNPKQCKCRKQGKQNSIAKNRDWYEDSEIVINSYNDFDFPRLESNSLQSLWPPSVRH